MLSGILLLLAGAGTAVAQRPSNVSICDYYTTALLKSNTAENQLKLLTLIVNTAEIGNYTTPNVGVVVPGILNPGMYEGEAINLLPYFDGSLLSTDNGQVFPSSTNFLDGGGGAALKMSLPAFNMTSNQYGLLTHLYEFFGILLGCSMVGDPGFPKYGGVPSMYQVHKFMALDEKQVGYFIQQVGLSAASFGVASSDVTAVGDSLNKLFNYKCSPPTTVVPVDGPLLQAICVAESCPVEPMDPTCGKYDNLNGTSPQPYPVNPMSPTCPTCPTCPMSPECSSCPTCPMAPSCPAPAMSIVSMSTEMYSSMPTEMYSSMHTMAPSTPVSTPAAPMPLSSSCPLELGDEYQFPHLIVPVSSESPSTAYGTSYFGEVSPTMSSIFDFDLPASYAGMTCNLVFSLPEQSQLQTSSYTLSGSGAITFISLSAPATDSTTYATTPAAKFTIGTITVEPGNSYVLRTYPCPGGVRLGVEAMSMGGTSLKYFQDYNPCPIGLYITAS